MYTFSQLMTIVLLFTLITFLATAFIFHAAGARSQFKFDSTTLDELNAQLADEQEDNARLSFRLVRLDHWLSVEDVAFHDLLAERAANKDISWQQAYELWETNRPTVAPSQLFDQDKE
ncbi:hypothetical protein SEA_ZHENGYI_26 [Microbacterium phage Zhengyi]|nr:hypothetical protein SEA_ZHENGYI_26 [Microbacterium phage Zhengyi]